MNKLSLIVKKLFMTKLQFVKRLKELRIASGISQANLCKEMDIGQRLYEFYESEKYSSIPTHKNLIKLANFFDCSIDYLLCQTDNPNRNK